MGWNYKIIFLFKIKREKVKFNILLNELNFKNGIMKINGFILNRKY